MIKMVCCNPPSVLHIDKRGGMCLCLHASPTLKPLNVKPECTEDSTASVLGGFTPAFRAADL